MKEVSVEGIQGRDPPNGSISIPFGETRSRLRPSLLSSNWTLNRKDDLEKMVLSSIKDEWNRYETD